MDGRMIAGAAGVAHSGKVVSLNNWMRWAMAGVVTLGALAAIVHAQAMGKVEVDAAPVASTEKPAAQAAQMTPQAMPERTVGEKKVETSTVAPHATEEAAMPSYTGLSMPALPVNFAIGGTAASAASGGPMSFAPINTPATTEPAAPNPAVPAAPSSEPPAKPQAQASVVSTPAVPVRDIEHMAISKSIPASTASDASASQTGSAETHSTGSALWSGMGSLGQVGAALAIVIGLILVGKALARKFVPGARAANGKGVIEILARHPLAKNQSIVLVRIGSQIVALNQGREASESILVISEPTEVAKIIGQIEGQSPTSIQAGFTKLLANARMDLEQGSEAETEQEGDLRSMTPESLDEQLEEMAAAKRQLMELRQHVRSVRDSLPRA